MIFTAAAVSSGSDGASEAAAGQGDHQSEQPSQPDDHAASLPARLREVYANRTGPSERSLLLSWAAFGLTFGAVRLVTHTLRRVQGSGGSGGIEIDGRHLHHYNLGILVLASVGAVAVHGQDARRRHPMTAAAYGSGLALIVDELALLLDLSDVYWANDGRVSVDVAVAGVAAGGTLLAAVPFWRGALHEITRTRGSN